MSEELKESDGIYIEITGTFTFSIDQMGLNGYNKEELQDAIDDFWDEFANSRDMIDDNNIAICYDWDSDNLKVDYEID